MNKLKETVSTLEGTVNTMSDELQHLRRQAQAQKKTTEKLLNRLHNTKNTCVIIAGGINNCTFKDLQSGKYYFNFNSEAEMTSHLVAEFENVEAFIEM